MISILNYFPQTNLIQAFKTYASWIYDKNRKRFLKVHKKKKKKKKKNLNLK